MRLSGKRQQAANLVLLGFGTGQGQKLEAVWHDIDSRAGFTPESHYSSHLDNCRAAGHGVKQSLAGSHRGCCLQASPATQPASAIHLAGHGEGHMQALGDITSEKGQTALQGLSCRLTHGQSSCSAQQSR